MNMKKILAILLSLTMILSFAACGQTENEAEAPANSNAANEPAQTPADNAERHYAVDENTVVLCTADEAPSITARQHNATAAGYINNLTYESLIRMTIDLAPEPCLAESWDYENQADGTTLWTFHLREGVKFHNGMTMTADDVVASLQEAKVSPDIAAYAKEYDNVQKVDDMTVTMTTNGPSAALLYDLCHHGNAIVPAKLLEEGHDFNEDAIGTGPYMFKWNISESMTLEAFPDYWEGEPAIKTMILKIIPEGSARTIALQAHEVDYVIDLDSNDIGLIEEDSTLSLINVDSLTHNWLCINNQKEPYDNVLFRKAMNAAVNKEDCVTVALNGAGVVAPGQTPLGQLGFDATGCDGYDVELAKKYQQESGVDLNGVVLEVICSDDTKRRAAQVIQENLNTTFGMAVEVVSMDLATYLSETAAGNFTGFIGNYTSSDMMSFLKGVYHAMNIGASNKTRTNDPHLDGLIEKACATVDNAEREAILKETSRYLNDLCCQIPLYQQSALSASNKYLTGIEISPSKRCWVEKWSWQ